MNPKITCKGKNVLGLIKADEELKKKGASTGVLVWVLVTVCSGVLLVVILAGSFAFWYIRKKQIQDRLLYEIWQVEWTSVDVSDELLGSSTTISGSTIDPSFPVHFKMVGTYEGEKVVIKARKKKGRQNQDEIKIRNRDNLLLLKTMKNLNHDNLNNFLGLCLNIPENSMGEVWSFAIKGSLRDIIYNGEMELDKTFKLSLASDVIKGLTYLHSSKIGPHGRLLLSNCVVDNRWCAKITDYGLDTILAEMSTDQLEKQFDRLQDLIYLAPEVVKSRSSQIIDGKWPRISRQDKTTKEDIYALGMVLYQVFFRMDPYNLAQGQESPSVIVDRILRDANSLPRIPTEEEVAGAGQVADLVMACLLRLPTMRPEVTDIQILFQEKFPDQGSSIIEHMVMLMEKYTATLEEKTKQLQEQRLKADTLLSKILPKSIAQKLQNGQHVAPESFECATIFFSDIVGFTILCSQQTPTEVVSMLNQLYSGFDSIISQHDAYKVEVIGDAYLIASGVPNRNGNRHILEISRMSVKIVKFLKKTVIPHLSRNLQVRIGFHSGPVAAGVVGLSMPRYCLFGDTVNVASRMESSGRAMKIHISIESKVLLEEQDVQMEFLISSRGPIEIKDSLKATPKNSIHKTTDQADTPEVKPQSQMSQYV